MDKNENERELLNMNTSGSILLNETVVKRENNCLIMFLITTVLGISIATHRHTLFQTVVM